MATFWRSSGSCARNSTDSDCPLTGFPAREVTRRVREYELADAILCPSGFVKESFVAEGVPAGRVHVVPYGIPQPEAESTPASRDDGTFRVLYVGQLTPRKGVRYLLEAFAFFRHPKKELLVVGPRSEPSGLEGAAVPDHVRFAGVLKGEALACAYRDASVFVLPTLEEGLALVLGEALAARHAGDHDGQQRRGRSLPGWQGGLPNTHSRSWPRWRAKMQLLADDPGRRERMSHAAHDRGRTLGGWDVTNRLLIETLRGIAAGGGREMKFTPATA